MAGCCGPKCSKAFVILYNLLFWISGCAFVALGVVLLYDKAYSYLYILLSQNVDKYPREIVDYIAYGSIGVGGLILFVGFFGCCGALQESKCMIGTYIFFLILICFLEAAIGLGTFYCWWSFPDEPVMKAQLKTKWSGNYTLNKEFTEAFDHAQATMHCCGIESDQDYTQKQFGSGSQYGGGQDQYNTNSNYGNQQTTFGGSGQQQQPGSGNRGFNNGKFNLPNGEQFPRTCCVLRKAWQESPIWKEPNPEKSEECQKPQSTNPNQSNYEGTQKQYRYSKGCFEPIMSWYWLYLIIIGATSGGLALLQIVGVLFSLCLIRNIGEEA